VHAAIDISDGLAADLAHVCEASGVGVRVLETSLPADAALEAAVRTLSALAGDAAGEGALLTRLRLGASDDYELLLMLDPGKWSECDRLAHELGVPLARIGDITVGSARVLATAAGADAALDMPGWDPFSSRG
jgi:thiamine-monophosphate kinase